MAQTPNPHRRLRYSMAPTPNPAPFLTPRAERRSVTDLRWADAGISKYKNDKEQEIPVQVVLRCRPLNEEEQKMNIQSVISCNERTREVSIPQNLLTKQSDKSFTFDKVFGPKSQQRAIYDHAISPIINEVIEGYNCTIFAFGQTGTGKTYTMEGDMKSKVEDLSAKAGIIPRAVKHIFDILEERKTDYNMKVTFLELYNEEITDLLTTEEQNKYHYEDKQKKIISLLEDGKGGEIIRGLEEIAVYNANEIYDLLELGSTRRRSVDTLINKQSSRSHVVFSINIHMKEEKWGDEELLKFGRLNLVDLAGSENIAKSGAKEGKAREAGEINKSLLTLGRVITALAEHSTHIPYRNSKLTRLLRESLGGKAKTCIIATISPCINCLEETLITLDYASKAKKIKNKPEANQRVSKSALLKDLQSEIDKMKQDVKAAREKNGIYLPQERFAQEEREKKVMRDKIEHLEILHNQTRKECERLKQKYYAEKNTNSEKDDEIKEYKINIENTQRDLHNLEEINSKINMELKEKDFIISSLLSRDNVIINHAKDLENTLSSKIERQSNKEGKNKEIMQDLNSKIENGLNSLQKTVNLSVIEQSKLIESTQEHVSSYFQNKTMEIAGLKERIEKNKHEHDAELKNLNDTINKFKNISNIDYETIESSLARQVKAIDHFMTRAVSESGQILSDIYLSLDQHNNFINSSYKQHEQMLQKSVNSTQEISKGTINFFNEMKNRFYLLNKNIEEKNVKAENELEHFQRAFMEASADQERHAFNQIAAILSNLTFTKNQMVSNAVYNLNENIHRDNNEIINELKHMHQYSDNKENEWLRFTENLEKRHEEDRAENDNIRAKSVDKANHCLKRVDDSINYWLKTQFSLEGLNKDYYEELDHYSKTKKREVESYLKAILNISLKNESEFKNATSDILNTSQKLLELDIKTKDKLENFASSSKYCLESLEHNNSKTELLIKNMMNKCLQEDYLVGSPMGNTNTQSAPVHVTSLESIEEMRADLSKIVAEFREKNKVTIIGEENKKVRMVEGERRRERSPLAPLVVNHNDD